MITEEKWGGDGEEGKGGKMVMKGLVLAGELTIEYADNVLQYHTHETFIIELTNVTSMH